MGEQETFGFDQPDNTTMEQKVDKIKDILSTKVPTSAGQIEQIVVGLAYKILNDIDEDHKARHKTRIIFVGKYAKFSWERITDPQADMVFLYRQAISNLYNHTYSLPLLRIFKNTIPPFNDESVLRLFLQEIAALSRSEHLEQAVDYILSTLDAQGNIGQYRTPRHIIDFIVKLMNPQVDETICDPSCGTADFLVSAFLHIKEDDLASEYAYISEYLHGYEIDPAMVRISILHTYLHGITKANVDEYDTLTLKSHWDEKFDVIFANPPFTKTGKAIIPHDGFDIVSKKTELLFIDYIASHLTDTGRAAIIIPNGVLFRAGKDYIALRKKIVEQSLVAVISLPAGVFYPHSGVKTSILILDKKISKVADSICFAEVKNDGFSLNTKRYPIEENDLARVIKEVQAWFQAAPWNIGSNKQITPI